MSWPRQVRPTWVRGLKGSYRRARQLFAVAFCLTQWPRHVPACTRAEEVVTRQWPGQIVRQPPTAPVTTEESAIEYQPNTERNPGANTSEFLADHRRYFADAQFCAFGGPCVHFHRECLRAGEREFLSDRHVEMLYATLTAWGMHRMGDNDRTKTKLVDWDAFRKSLLAQRDTFSGLRHLRLLDLSEDDYADALTELEPAYRKLNLSAAGATVVVNSKAIFHVLPHLVPPIDRQYTVRFFRQPRDRWRDSKGKFRMIMLPASLDAQVGLFRSLCLEIKRLADRVDPDIFELELREHEVTPPKAMDNAIVTFVRSHARELHE